LRQVIFKILAAVIILFPAAFYFAGDLIVLLVNYSCPEGFALRYFSLMEPLFVKIKISLLAAFFVALPYVAWEVWKFVVPALYPNEKRTIKRLTLSSWALFLAGVTFCFFFVIPAMMRFSLSMQSDELQAAIGLNNYIGLAGMLLLGFGIMFQLPIVIFFLALSGMIQIKTLKKLRPLVMIAILTLSALLTPPDVFSQLMMAVPTYLLFEVSLLLSSLAVRSDAADKEEDIADITENSYDDDFFEPEPEPEGYKEYYRNTVRKRKLHYIARR
ncbi:MAG: twin-arginine translocase subunit TatC, partial [Victivallales bacterium]